MRDQGVVAIDHVFHARVGGHGGLQRGVAAVHQAVGGRDGDDVTRGRVDGEVHIGQHAAKGAGAGDRHQAADLVGQARGARRADTPAGDADGVGRAVVRGVGVAADDQVDRVVQALDDGADVGIDACGFQVAVAAVDVADIGAGLEAALVHQHHDRLDALGAQLGHQGVDGVGFVLEAQAGHAGGRDDAGRALERHADEGHLDAVEGLDAVGRQQRAAGGGFDHVGRQPLELGAVKRARRGRAQAAAAVGVGLAVGDLAAAVLQALELGRALVELVVADGVEFDADVVQGFDRGLVVEQRRDQRRGADEVTGTDHHVQRVGCFEFGHFGGHELGATHGRTLRRGDGGVDTEGARRLQVAVEVVEADQLDGEGHRLGRGDGVNGADGGERQGGGQQGAWEADHGVCSRYGGGR
jgi:hypothetical protein